MPATPPVFGGTAEPYLRPTPSGTGSFGTPTYHTLGPPNSVALASPIPNSYFGGTFGALSGFRSHFQFPGLMQPFIPAAHPDVDSTGRTLPFLSPYPAAHTPPLGALPVGTPVTIQPSFNPMPPIKPVRVDPFLGNIRYWVDRLRIGKPTVNPVSYWAGQLRGIFPGIPERGQ